VDEKRRWKTLFVQYCQPASPGGRYICGMSTIHHTTMAPTKLQLLAGWLPGRPWYRGGAGTPELARAGGFRLDDPEGEVGIEFMAVTDSRDGQPVTYHVPMTYRGAPLEDAVGALIGTAEHGVLGTRWIYDGTRDPVLTGQLLALLAGRAVPQMQSVSDTPDPGVVAHLAGSGISSITEVADSLGSTDIRMGSGATLRVNRILQPEDSGPAPAAGHVTAHWMAPDGSKVRGRYVVLS
jgi:hypothetical protein